MKHYYIALGLLALAAIVALLGRSKARKTDAYSLYVDAASPSELAPGVPGFYGGQVAAVNGQPQLTTPYSRQPCVWYKYVLEQETMQRDTNGVEMPQWNVISEEPPQGVMFLLQNPAGGVYVNPLSANVDDAQQYQGLVDPVNTQGQSGAAATVGNVANFIANHGMHKMRVTEHYIPLGQQLYVGGVAQDQNGQKVFATDPHYPLVLTPRSRSDLVKSGRRTSMLEYGGAVLLLAVAIIVAVKK